MRPFEGTMPLTEARAVIDQAIVPIERTESIRVLDANGRVLAVTSPPTLAMDTSNVDTVFNAGKVIKQGGRLTIPESSACADSKRQTAVRKTCAP